MSGVTKPQYNYPSSEDVRIKTLEVNQEHILDKVQEHSQDIKNLGSKVSDLTHTMSVLNTTLPYLIRELGEVVNEFKEFKENFVQRQFSTLTQVHQKELVTTEVHTKFKFLWVGLGVIGSALLALLVKIIVFRFNS